MIGPFVLLAAVALVIAACLVSQTSSPYLYDGGSLGPCTGNVARQIPTDQCPGCSSEDSGVAYAQCTGTSYTDCTCVITCGYTLLDDQGNPADGGPRGQSISNKVPPDGGPQACCGNVAEEIPASACYGCKGTTAYALCDDHGVLTCACACDLPAGYTLVEPDGAAAPGDAGTGG